jgi:nitrogen fixation protein NifZ
MQPRYDYGDEVRVLRNVRNDGTFPGQPTGALLVRRGSTGYVRDVGSFLQDQLIYSVHFLDGDRIVGCREEELQPASDPWTPSRFESREKVSARIALGRGGRVLVEQGRVGEIMKVLRGSATAEQSGEVAYHVLFPGCSLLQVPESALEPASSPSASEAALTEGVSNPNPSAIAEQSP